MALEFSKEKDFSEWYTEVVLKSELADYASVHGCMVFRELSYGIWENIQDAFDGMIKSTGHKNAYFPMFIPKGLLMREAEHFSGFTPEVAWVTRGGDTELEEPIAIRPTSETIMYDSYSKWIHSWRDLPLLLNQWCSVVRWETKATKPFLRTREFLWQEGHTVHETKEDAEREVMLILGFYKRIVEDYLAIPVLLGMKSEGEKFAGAFYTTAIEAMMPDGKALQCGTSHHLGQNFAKAFGIKFKGRDEKEEFAWQTSWGSSTRLIGALVMVHGDDKGLVIPPRVAPIKVVIVPIAYSKQEEKDKVASYCKGLKDGLLAAGLPVYLDNRDDKSAGWKYNEWELRGVPVRLEVGLRDIEKNAVMAVRRDSGQETQLPIEGLASALSSLLEEIQKSLFSKAKAFLERSISEATDYEGFKSALESKKGFIKVSWCDTRECEDAVNKDTTATVRVIPFEGALPKHDKCFRCGQPAKTTVYFAKSY